MIRITIYSHNYFEKGSNWFFAVYGVLFLFAALFIYLAQYTGAAVMLAVGIIIYNYAKISPKEISCTIFPEGVQLDDRTYHFSALKSFWVADVLPHPILYLEPAGRFHSLISLSLEKQPTEPIRKVLLSYLPEKGEAGESFLDKIMRIVRF